MTTEIRERNCCPSCKSINIAKYRKLSGNYKCKSCNAIFTTPAMKEVKTHNKIPGCLKKIIAEKQESELAGESLEAE